MINSKWVLKLALAISLFSANLMAAGDPVAGEIKFETCRGCHAIPSYFNVYPSYHVPKIWGQHPDYIVAALKAYREGARSHDTMQANSANLTDQDMEDIAAYLQLGNQ